MTIYRKKPVIIEAMQWDGTRESANDIIEWMGGAGRFIESEVVNSQRFKPELYIVTLEDGANGNVKHAASPNDFVIKGVQGEFYACKPDIFEATYEEVE